LLSKDAPDKSRFMATIVPLEASMDKPKRLLDQRVKASLTRQE
jgi:hypothetical protein